jgi:tetratricopeptide (TPR) repeat protein
MSSIQKGNSFSSVPIFLAFLCMGFGDAVGPFVGLAKEEFDSAKQLLDIYQENPTVNQFRILFYVEQGLLDEALTAAGNLAESSQSPATGLYLKGRVLYAKGDIGASIDSYNKALKIAPEQLETSFALAEAYQASGARRAALEVCDRALEQSPNNSALLILKAGIYEGLAEYEKAAEVYEAVLSINDNQHIAKNNLATLLVDHLLNEENLQLAQELTVDFENTEVPAFWDTRGWVLYHKKNYTSALVLLERAVASNNPLGIFRYHLGMTHYRLNDTISAKEELELALESDEVFTGIEEARKIVGSL